MTDYVAARLEQLGMDVERDRFGQILARKGNTHGQKVPYYVAHADTVFPIVPDKFRRVGWEDRDGDRFYFAYDPTDGTYRGVGGDDKCGIFLCIEAAKRLKDVVVLITVDEEIGGVGARSLDTKVFNDAAVLIQADRRGNNEAIYESGAIISSAEWRDHVDHVVRAYGYHWSDRGTFTDVSLLVEDGTSPVSAVNLGAGYWNYHSSREYISENDLKRCVNLGIALGRASTGIAWVHEKSYSWEDLPQGIRYTGDGVLLNGRLVPYDELDDPIYGSGVRGYGNDPVGSRFWDEDDLYSEEGHELPKEMSHEELVRHIVESDNKVNKAREDRLDQLKRKRRESSNTYGSRSLSFITCKVTDCDRPTHGVTEEGEWFCQKHYFEATEAKAMLYRQEALNRIRGTA